MRLLRDTHLLLWAAGTPDRLSAEARALIEGLALLTADEAVGRYPGPIRVVARQR